MATPDTRMTQAQQLLGRHAYAEAIALLQQLQRSRPRDVGVLSELGRACMLAGQSAQAEAYARAALVARADDPVLLTNLALVLLNQSTPNPAKRADAIGLLRKAVAIAPTLADAQVLLIQAFVEDSKIGEAFQLCEAAAKHIRDPDLASYHALCASFLGQSRTALAILDRAIGEMPRVPNLRLAKCVLAHTIPAITPRDIAAWHADFGTAIAATIPCVQLPPRAQPRSRTRVGVLSPDLRRHSVAAYARVIFEHLDPSAFELYAYHLWAHEDEVSEQLRARCARWTNVAQMTDEALVQRIASDDLDVLLDLAGLTSGSRPRVLAAKPARRIVTYCGYPDTTGLTSIDARIVDSLTDPSTSTAEPTFDARCTERLVRLDPCFLCYSPPTEAPPVRPRDASAPIRFGSFNAVRKYNLETFHRWARVLNAVPGSTLTLKWGDVQDAAVRASVERMLREAGLFERTTILPRTKGTAEHLACYHDIDIALDTHPYHGTTTTCEALLMGVPTVTLVGELHVSRVGLSLLTQVGLAHLAAKDDATYQLAALQLANDRPTLVTLRASLRPRLFSSPLCDAPAFAARYGAMLRELAAIR